MDHVYKKFKKYKIQSILKRGWIPLHVNTGGLIYNEISSSELSVVAEAWKYANKITNNQEHF
jgi:hypothetical protein